MKNHQLKLYLNLKNLQAIFKLLLKLNLINNHLLFILLVDYIFVKLFFLILKHYFKKLIILSTVFYLQNYKYQTNYSFCIHYFK